jgi:hypothetical protein
MTSPLIQTARMLAGLPNKEGTKKKPQCSHLMPSQIGKFLFALVGSLQQSRFSSWLTAGGWRISSFAVIVDGNVAAVAKQEVFGRLFV